MKKIVADNWVNVVIETMVKVAVSAFSGRISGNGHGGGHIWWKRRL